jgi:hypothetical protein
VMPQKISDFWSVREKKEGKGKGGRKNKKIPKEREGRRLRSSRVRVNNFFAGTLAHISRWDGWEGRRREGKKSKTDFFINYDFCEFFFQCFFSHRRWWRRRREREREMREMLSNGMLAWCISTSIGQVSLEINTRVSHMTSQDFYTFSFEFEMLMEWILTFLTHYLPS